MNDENPKQTEDQKSIEAEYRKTVKKFLPKIEAKLSQAEKLINEATDIADEHGIPFYGICPLSQQYTPEGVPTLHDDVDCNQKLFEEITGCSPDSEYGNTGWEHSASC